MSDFFRIVRGLQIDESVHILQGSVVPGTSLDTIAAKVGSIYLTTSTGTLYTKVSPGPGTAAWLSSVGGGSTLSLYSEFPGISTPPSPLGENSISLGSGSQTATTGINSLAIGDQSLARHQGSVVVANGRFGTTGDAQVGTYLPRGVTSTNFQSELFLDGPGGSKQLTLPDNCTWTFTITVTGHQTNNSGRAGYTFVGVVYRDSGASTVAFQGRPVKTVVAESSPAWDANISVDPSTGSLVILVKGQTGSIVRWLARVETTELTN